MKLDPRTMRERLVKSYSDSYRKAGIEMSPQQVERQVIADCELVDNARAAGDLSGPPKKQNQDPRPSKPRSSPLVQAELENGVAVQKERGQRIRPRALFNNPQKTSERWGAAVARIARILEGTRKDTSSLVVAVEDAELGALATEYFDLWSHFTTRHAPPPLSGKDRNPFRWMNDGDAAKKFIAMVENICDRSTGKLGAWFNGISVTAAARNRAR